MSAILFLNATTNLSFITDMVFVSFSVQPRWFTFGAIGLYAVHEEMHDIVKWLIGFQALIELQRYITVPEPWNRYVTICTSVVGHNLFAHAIEQSSCIIPDGTVFGNFVAKVPLWLFSLQSSVYWWALVFEMVIVANLWYWKSCITSNFSHHAPVFNLLEQLAGQQGDLASMAERLIRDFFGQMRQELSRIHRVINQTDNPSYNPTNNTTQYGVLLLPESRCDVVVDCSICGEHIPLKYLHRKLPCNHTFHIECIDRWFQQNFSCPVCRCRFVMNSQGHMTISES
jgi:hypothetical protein